MAFEMNKLAMNDSCEITVEKYKYFFLANNYFEIQVHTLLVCALYLIKYSS
jgi:hypothetical protein